MTREEKESYIFLLKVISPFMTEAEIEKELEDIELFNKQQEAHHALKKNLLPQVIRPYKEEFPNDDQLF